MKVFLVLIVIMVFMLSGCSAINENTQVNDFESCVSAGFPVMESYPRQCRGPTGQVYVEQLENNTEQIN